MKDVVDRAYNLGMVVENAVKKIIEEYEREVKWQDGEIERLKEQIKMRDADVNDLESQISNLESRLENPEPPEVDPR